jgi:plasmid stability protein
MTTLTLELPADVYARLRERAAQQGATVEQVVQTLIAEQVPPAPVPTERERVREILRAAGMLAEPSPEMRRLAAESSLTLEEARAILDRAGGQPLSEVILEMRGPKQ